MLARNTGTQEADAVRCSQETGFGDTLPNRGVEAWAYFLSPKRACNLAMYDCAALVIRLAAYSACQKVTFIGIAVEIGVSRY
jgi:hypothetical protein